MFFKPAGVGNGHVLQIEGVIRSKQKLFGCSAPELYGFHQVKKLPPFLSRKPAKIGADIGVHMRVLPQDHSSGLVVDPPGVPHDDRKIREIAGYKLDARKDPGQRKECRCIESIDIGSYDTCINGCAYCYAVHSPASARKKYEQHDPASPLLVGRLRGDETITEKEIHSLRDNQLSLFD